MGAAITSRARLEAEAANLRKKLTDMQRSVQRSQRDKESYLVSRRNALGHVLCVGGVGGDLWVCV